MNSILFIIILFPIFSLASVDIAFIEIKTLSGKVLQLEPDGRFAHIAISYRGQWLHSHPYRGVEVVSRKILEQMGAIKEIITISDAAEPGQEVVANLVGKPYDSHFSWDSEFMYCSELVAKLLKIEPEPMRFSPALWPKKYQILRGELGLSPDDIYQMLRQRGHLARPSAPLCPQVFR